MLGWSLENEILELLNDKGQQGFVENFFHLNQLSTKRNLVLSLGLHGINHRVSAVKS